MPTWRTALTIRQGYELNDPLLTVALAPHQGPLPGSQSLFAADADNVIVTAIKKDEDDEGLTLRLYEWRGRKSGVHLKLPAGWRVAAETNLMEKVERPLAAAEVVYVDPYEIKTIRLERGR